MSSGPSQIAQRDWSNERRKVAYQEARAVLEAQRATLNDIDDKAMRTVRIAVLVFGVLVSAIQLNGVSLNSTSYILAEASGVLFLFTIAAGVFTYTQSRSALGPNKSYIDELSVGRFDHQTWDEDLLDTFGDWIEETRWVVTFNARLLLLTQILFVVAIALAALAVRFSIPPP